VPSKITYIVIPLLIWLAAPANASTEQADPEFEALIEMPINDLMNVVVSVASLEDENLIESPAIVSSFKRKDMQSLGLRSLKDILSFFPGFIVNEPLSGAPVVQIRGLMDINNQKILFLLDDTPYWIAANGNIPILGIPFELIEKVEVIRGPGSVIYGTNASAGVIKIITRKEKASDVNLKLGDHDTANVSGYHKWEPSSNSTSSTRFGYEFQVSDGYSATIENALTGPPGLSPTENGNIRRSEEKKSIYLSHTRKSFNSFLHASETEKSGSSFGSVRSASIYRENSLMVHADYTFINDRLTTNVFAEYNNYYSTIDIDDLLILWNIPGDGEFSYEDDGKDNYRMRGGFQSKLKVSDNHALLIGAEHEKRSTGNYLLLDDNNGNNLNAVPIPGFSTTPGYNGILIHSADNSKENTIYAQSDSTHNNFRFLLGIRYVDNSKSGHKFIPRLAAVYQLDQTQSLKALYSVGFNSPTFRQNADVGAFGTSTNSMLEAETVRSYDLAYNYTYSGSLFVANLFLIQARDIIGSVNGVFVNSEDFERSGIELDYQLTRKSWLMYSNISYLLQGTENDANDLSAAYAPRWNFSVGANYKLKNKHSLGTSLRYLSERINAQDHSIVNLDYQFRQLNYTLYATILNILDEQITHPDVRTIGTTDIKIDAYPERSIFLGLEYRY
jgi:outer membrane receptor protein involved in Fe transport